VATLSNCGKSLKLENTKWLLKEIHGRGNDLKGIVKTSQDHSACYEWVIRSQVPQDESISHTAKQEAAFIWDAVHRLNGSGFLVS
jgi:hypothetical protein